MRLRMIIIVCAAILMVGTVSHAAVPTSITVQGKLTDSVGTPLLPGSKSFTFRIFDDTLGGLQIWPPTGVEFQSINSDAAGLWTALVGKVSPLTDPVFSSEFRWLEISVNGVFLPLVRIVTGPYAFRVATVDGALGGTIWGPLSVGTNVAIGSSLASGTSNTASGVNSVAAGGNSNAASSVNTFVGGGFGNSVSNVNAAIVGGNSNVASGGGSFIGGGFDNLASNSHSFATGEANQAIGPNASVTGGRSNVASDSFSVVGGGDNNTASGVGCGVASGRNNSVVNSQFCFIGGGLGNEINADVDGRGAAIVGGDSNTVNNSFSFIGGGRRHVVNPSFCAVVGGSDNYINSAYSAILGGSLDSAVGLYSAVLGGEFNRTGGQHCVAAGRRAKSVHNDCFVWADATNSDFATTGINQFLIRASGGVGIGTNTPEGPLHIFRGSAGTVTANVGSTVVLEDDASHYIALMSPDDTERGILFGSPANNVMGSIRFNVSTARKGMHFRTGNNLIRLILDSLGTLTADGCIVGSNIACPSDARFKRSIETLPNALDRVAQLRGVSYEWEREKFADREFPAGLQMGLIAQEVREVVPQAVIEQSDGYLAVDYARLVPLLIEGMKEQQVTIQEQGKRIEVLEKKLEQSAP